MGAVIKLRIEEYYYQFVRMMDLSTAEAGIRIDIKKKLHKKVELGVSVKKEGLTGLRRQEMWL